MLHNNVWRSNDFNFNLVQSIVDTQELVDICVNKFGPEFSNATKLWRPLPKSQRLKLGDNVFGMGFKFIYALLWQVSALSSHRKGESG